jgi:hypothetical protein
VTDFSKRQDLRQARFFCARQSDVGAADAQDFDVAILVVGDVDRQVPTKVVVLATQVQLDLPQLGRAAEVDHDHLSAALRGPLCQRVDGWPSIMSRASSFIGVARARAFCNEIASSVESLRGHQRRHLASRTDLVQAFSHLRELDQRGVDAFGDPGVAELVVVAAEQLRYQIGRLAFSASPPDPRIESHGE